MIGIQYQKMLYVNTEVNCFTSKHNRIKLNFKCNIKNKILNAMMQGHIDIFANLFV